MEQKDGAARASFDVRGGVLHVTDTHVVLEGETAVRIPLSDVEACRSKKRALEVVWSRPGRTRLVLRTVSAPAAAAEAAVFGAAGRGAW